MAFIVKERDQVSRANAQTPNFFSPFVSFFQSHVETLKGSYKAALEFQQMWQPGLIWHPRKGGGEGRKEGGEGQNSTSGFYQRLIWSQQQALKHSVDAE